MKKILIALATLGLLASCGQNTTTNQDSTNTSKTTTQANANSCEAYYEYMTCAFKKKGLDEAGVDAMVGKTKEAMNQVQETQRAQLCEKGMEAFKENNSAEGC